MPSCIIETPLGYTRIVGDGNGIHSIKVLDTDAHPSNKIPTVLHNCVCQLKAYFDNSLTDFDLNLNPKGTPFQKRVWTVLCDIPFGKTTSYLQLSKVLGDIKAIRAVANANAKNPLWIVIPCHRVIGTDGSLTGYAGGLYRKQWLLNHESPIKQQSLF